MKMKKFLILYFIFVFLLLILYLALISKASDARQETVVRKNHKNTVVIITDKFEPMGRVICQTPKRTMIYDWKSAEDAVLELKEMEERYRKCERNYEFFIQYDNCHID